MNEQGISGWLEAYWEQGWEGSFLPVFRPEGTHALEDLIFLENGQGLVVFDEQGSRLWEGKIRFTKRRWWDRAPSGCRMWSTTKFRGVRYSDWIRWFWKGPTRAMFFPK